MRKHGLPLTVREALARFREHDPIDAVQCRKKCRMNLRRIGKGAERTAYRVGDLPLVIKFPNIEGHTHQSNTEIKAYHKLRSLKDPVVTPFLPKVHYHNEQTGAVAMHLYQGCRSPETAYSAARQAFSKQKSVWPTDIHLANLAETKKGQVKVIDLGCFSVREAA